MGKVVSLFGNRSDENKEPEEASSPPDTQPAHDVEETKLAILADYLYYRDNDEQIKLANLTADEMTTFLFDVMNLVKNDNNIELRRGAMKAMSLEQLTDYLINSGKVQWKAQPHMYGAAYLEFVDRLMVVSMLIEELKKRTETTEE